MAEALSVVKNEGLSVRLSAAKNGVPKSSLGDRLSGRVRKEAINGKALLLSPNDEKLLKETAKQKADLGIGFSKKRVISFKKKMVDPLRKEKQWYLFKNARGNEENSPQIMVPECSKMYFGVFKDVLTENNLLDKPMFIWNMDETLASLSHD
ncbi:hypothetical protein KUTeg_008598 [Tegillarca granosa]|uniref:Transposase n=1 Tax=Tegillarca granosa TaxID=220873 RepID=A0ABQ9FDV4_TEGGR|nr:hypothetical protein KUTeg_008598 [Tegillarca granosa]